MFGPPEEPSVESWATLIHAVTGGWIGTCDAGGAMLARSLLSHARAASGYTCRT